MIKRKVGKKVVVRIKHLAPVRFDVVVDDIRGMSRVRATFNTLGEAEEALKKALAGHDYECQTRLLEHARKFWSN